jgi:hypothetical protein
VSINVYLRWHLRAAREGLRIRFDEGFAETLPYPDGSFDVLVSMFGIMFSPHRRQRQPGSFLSAAALLACGRKWSR